MSTLDHAFIRAFNPDAAKTPEPAQQPFPMPATIKWRVDPGIAPSVAPGPMGAVPQPHLNLTSFIRAGAAAETIAADSAIVAGAAPATGGVAATLDFVAGSREPFTFEPYPGNPFPAAATSPPRSAYEVDAFAWPAICHTLGAMLPEQIDSVVRTLVDGASQGRKVVALAGARRGEGRTTLSLVLARRLAESGATVLLVDGDLQSPELAATLGLAVECDWLRGLAEGLPVWDSMIESLADRLAILPLLQTAAAERIQHHAAAAQKQFDVLRDHFDIVLVDAGARHAAALPALLTTTGLMDAVILAADARQPAGSELAEMHRRLVEAGITVLGVAETFYTERTTIPMTTKHQPAALARANVEPLGVTTFYVDTTCA